MPREILPHSFVEQTLTRMEHLEVWVELVRKRSPHAIRLGEATMTYIQGMLIRSRVPSKRRILETLDPADLEAYLTGEQDPTEIWDAVDEGVLTSADEASRPASREGYNGRQISYSQPAFGSMVETNDLMGHINPSLLTTSMPWDDPSGQLWMAPSADLGNSEFLPR